MEATAQIRSVVAAGQGRDRLTAVFRRLVLHLQGAVRKRCQSSSPRLAAASHLLLCCFCFYDDHAWRRASTSCPQEFNQPTRPLPEQIVLTCDVLDADAAWPALACHRPDSLKGVQRHQNPTKTRFQLLINPADCNTHCCAIWSTADGPKCPKHKLRSLLLQTIAAELRLFQPSPAPHTAASTAAPDC